MERVALEYGRGRELKQRRVSWMAVFSFLLGSILAAFAGFVLYVYMHPESGPNWEEFRWSLAVLILFNMLTVGTLVGAPLAVLLGIGVTVSLWNESGRRVSKGLAHLGLLLSILVSAGVIAGTIKFQHELQSSRPKLSPSASADLQAVATISSQIDQLIDDCALYAHSHGNDFPPDSLIFENWIQSQDPKLVPLLSQFDYFGGGVKYKPMATVEDIQEGQGILILVSHNTLSDGSRVIGVRGEPMRSRARTIPGNQLQSWIESAKRRHQPTPGTTVPITQETSTWGFGGHESSKQAQENGN